MNKINTNGFSLIEMVLVMGMLGGFSLFFMQMNNNFSKQMIRMETKMAEYEMISNIRSTLYRKNNCLRTFSSYCEGDYTKTDKNNCQSSNLTWKNGKKLLEWDENEDEDFNARNFNEDNSLKFYKIYNSAGNVLYEACRKPQLPSNIPSVFLNSIINNANAATGSGPGLKNLFSCPKSKIGNLLTIKNMYLTNYPIDDSGIDLSSSSTEGRVRLTIEYSRNKMNDTTVTKGIDLYLEVDSSATIVSCNNQY